MKTEDLRKLVGETLCTVTITRFGMGMARVTGCLNTRRVIDEVRNDVSALGVMDELIGKVVESGCVS